MRGADRVGGAAVAGGDQDHAGKCRGDKGWAGYYAKTSERPPRETLLSALGRFEAEGKTGVAVDLGCGGGRDTVELLRRGWHVLAIDAEAAAIDFLRSRADLPATCALETRIARMEAAALPPCDLVNSSFALPLCPPERFPALWARIVAALRPGGRFAGQLYGDRDSWAGDPTLTHHARAEAEALFAGFAIESFREEESDSTTPRGTAKHWHIFHAVARKAG
ncbi:MAG: methyltransferase domain-containing protein [Rhodospirillaceae bacterium]|nr:methyltransferase domain-containing protein [Rhodospirillaceae bacterium]MBT6119454.1 methyltransferase domain-containing protein [Rhodospirillaceae bacterium]